MSILRILKCSKINKENHFVNSIKPSQAFCIMDCAILGEKLKALDLRDNCKHRLIFYIRE